MRRGLDQAEHSVVVGLAPLLDLQLPRLVASVCSRGRGMRGRQGAVLAAQDPGGVGVEGIGEGLAIDVTRSAHRGLSDILYASLSAASD